MVDSSINLWNSYSELHNLSQQLYHAENNLLLTKLNHSQIYLILSVYKVSLVMLLFLIKYE